MWENQNHCFFNVIQSQDNTHSEYYNLLKHLTYVSPNKISAKQRTKFLTLKSVLCNEVFADVYEHLQIKRVLTPCWDP